MPARSSKAARRPSALYLEGLLSKKAAETNELMTRVKELKSRAEMRDTYVADIETRLRDSHAKVRALESRIRVADRDIRLMDTTIESLARQLGELEQYKNARERADVRDGGMTDTDDSNERPSIIGHISGAAA